VTVEDPGVAEDGTMLPRDMAGRAQRGRETDPRPVPQSNDSNHSIRPGAGLFRTVADHDREAFLDILSHELRTPVTTIYGGAELLATRALDAGRRRTLTADLRAEADRLFRLVEDLVVIARSERDGVQPVGEPVAVGRLALAAIDLATARYPGLQVQFYGTSDAVADGADEGFVTHILRNLLDNAIRYGAAAGPIEVIVSEDEAEVAVKVIDRGEAPTQGRDPFALTSRTPVTAAGRAGGGIALYVADLLVHALRGRMWATPARPIGAEFGFSLSRSAGLRTSA
jgi:signal transduction histidine kinase